MDTSPGSGAGGGDGFDEPVGDDDGGQAASRQRSDEQSGRPEPSSDEGQSRISRRTLLAGGGAALVGTGLGAYVLTREGKDDSTEGTTGPDTEQVYSVLGEMQMGFRESPDHLPGTAQDLVEEGDPNAIFAFVRDDIATQPPRTDSNAGFATVTNGGARGTLRSGIGTPRDKAELLATLLERAGHAAEVRVYNRPIEASRAKELYFDPPDHEYDPGFTDEQRRRWNEQIDISDGQDLQTASDAGGDDGSNGSDGGTAAANGGTATTDGSTATDESGGSATPTAGSGATESASTEGGPTVVDENGEASAALAEEVRDGLPADVTPKSAKFEWETGGSAVPVVVFDPESGSSETAGTAESATGTTSAAETPTETPTQTATSTGSSTPSGDVQYANLFHGDELFGSLLEPEKLGEAVETSPQQVTVRLEAATADAPKNRTELVSGTWDAAKLAGRQVQVSTLPGVSPFDQPTIRFADVQKFVPTLAVQEPHSDQETLTDLSVVGDGFSIVGDRYTVEDDGTVKRNGEVMVQGDGASGGGTGEDGGGTDGGGGTATPRPLPDAVDNVADLSVDINAGGYKTIRLKMDPTDGSGNTVEGLPGRAFDVTEDGESVSATVQSNESKPKVGVYYDGSISMNIAGFYETERKKFRERMKSTLEEVRPDAQVEFERVGSDAWGNMAEAAATTDADLIIYYSDGDGYGSKHREDYDVALSEGPPAIMLSITGKRYDAAERMAELSGGTHISSNDPDDFLRTLREYVGRLDSEIKSYSLTYRSPGERDPGETRTVTVQVGDTDVSAEATYEVPSASIDPRSKRGLTGLYLTVETQTDGRNPSSTTSVRTLAGWDPRTENDRSPNWADRNEVFSALFGSVVLSFEAAGVSPSVFFDDIVTGKLSLKPLHDAAEAGDTETFDEMFDEGVGVTSHYPYEFHPHLPNRATADTLTYGTGIRTVLFQRLARFGEAQATQSVDILTTSSIRTITRDGDREREFDLTMDRTARYAVIERDAYETSTGSILDGMHLEPADRARKNWSNETKAQFNAATKRRSMSGDDYRVCTASVDTAAHWTVDRGTGAMLGVLPDGSGGSKEVQRIKEQLRRIKQVSYQMGIMMDAAPAAAGMGAMGVVVAYQRLLARLYALASISIATMSANDISADAKKLIANWACNMVIGLGFENVPIVGALLAINDIDGATDGSTVGCSAVSGSPLS